MTSIDEAPDVFVLLGLRAEDSVDLVKQDRGRTSVITGLAKQVSRRRVHRADRACYQWLARFQRSGLAALRLGRQEGEAPGTLECFDQMGVGAPQNVSNARMLGWITDEALQVCKGIIQYVRALICGNRYPRYLRYRLGWVFTKRPVSASRSSFSRGKRSALLTARGMSSYRACQRSLRGASDCSINPRSILTAAPPDMPLITNRMARSRMLSCSARPAMMLACR